MKDSPDFLDQSAESEKTAQDRPRNDQLLELSRQVYAALKVKEVTVLQVGWDSKESYKIGNSIVLPGPELIMGEIFEELDSPRIALATLRIRGDNSLDLHSHEGHVIQFVLWGSGWLHWSNDGGEKIHKPKIQEGDMLVIPSGVLHHSNCRVGEICYLTGVEITNGGSTNQLFYEKE